ncbi:MAG: hypothetical protein ACRD0O_05485 [Acidimicrobiia bacterium]
MARIVGVVNVSHSPVCSMPAGNWTELRRTRSLRPDVPEDSEAEQEAKAQRIGRAFEALSAELAAMAPDVLVIFGDDHYECFTFAGFPALAVFVGEKFRGASGLPARAADVGKNAGNVTQMVIGFPDLGGAIVAGLLRRGFDPAFCTEVAEGRHGLGHAIMRPLLALTDLSVPVVPILLNCYFPPQVTGRRAYEIGRAVGQAVEEHPSEARVVVVGSGGLWHTPGSQAAYIDEAFDRAVLDALCAGEPARMAELFDTYVPDPSDPSQAPPPGLRQTGMASLGGPQGGTRETCNWIAAAAAAEGAWVTLLDYIPVYASPVGLGFAYGVTARPRRSTSGSSTP